MKIRDKKEKPLGFLLGYIARQAPRYFSIKFDRFGLHKGSSYILKCLYDNDGIKQNKLAETLRIDKANITRSIASLEKLGYIKREPDEADSRIKLIFITEKAKAIKEDFLNVFSNWNDVLVNNFSEEEKQIFRNYLLRIENNVDEYLEKLDEE